MLVWIFIVLPAVSTLLIHRKLASVEKVDLYILRASSISATIGSFLVWSSHSILLLFPGQSFLVGDRLP